MLCSKAILIRIPLRYIYCAVSNEEEITFPAILNPLKFKAALAKLFIQFILDEFKIEFLMCLVRIMIILDIHSQ
jgi:hypothetical protein